MNEERLFLKLSLPILYYFGQDSVERTPHWLLKSSCYQLSYLFSSQRKRRINVSKSAYIGITLVETEDQCERCSLLFDFIITAAIFFFWQSFFQNILPSIRICLDFPFSIFYTDVAALRTNPGC